MKNFEVVREFLEFDHFGELGLYSKLPSTYCVHVVRNTVCGVIDAASFKEFMDNFKQAERRLFKLIDETKDVMIDEITHCL